jgi:hypothetical protein
MPAIKTETADAGAFFALALAARKSGDRELERSARRELLSRHGVRLSFPRGRGAGQEAKP